MKSLFDIDLQILEKELSWFMLDVTRFPTCGQTQYVGPMKQTSTPINLEFHCKV